MVGKKLEAELELFILDCHALSKDGIISKSEEIVMKRKIYRSLRNLLKQEPEQCQDVYKRQELLCVAVVMERWAVFMVMWESILEMEWWPTIGGIFP